MTKGKSEVSKLVKEDSESLADEAFNCSERIKACVADIAFQTMERGEELLLLSTIVEDINRIYGIVTELAEI